MSIAMTPRIRMASIEDLGALSDLKLRTFRETFLVGFGIPYPAEDLAIFERANYAPEAVMAELSDPGHMSWVAEYGDRLVAYAHVGPCKLPHADVRPGDGELYQIYVDAGAQGTGLGRALLDEAISYLHAGRPGPIWLGVWSGNLKAQAIYAANGFAKVGEYRFPVGSWEDDEFIFRRGAPLGGE